MYNKGTTPLSHGVGSTGVVHLLYMWCTRITSLDICIYIMFLLIAFSLLLQLLYVIIIYYSLSA
jgi:hypothetical protein